jgi:hypothetical protein
MKIEFYHIPILITPENDSFSILKTAAAPNVKHKINIFFAFLENILSSIQGDNMSGTYPARGLCPMKGEA